MQGDNGDASSRRSNDNSDDVTYLIPPMWKQLCPRGTNDCRRGFMEVAAEQRRREVKRRAVPRVYMRACAPVACVYLRTVVVRRLTFLFEGARRRCLHWPSAGRAPRGEINYLVLRRNGSSMSGEREKEAGKERESPAAAPRIDTPRSIRFYQILLRVYSCRRVGPRARSRESVGISPGNRP